MKTSHAVSRYLGRAWEAVDASRRKLLRNAAIHMRARMLLRGPRWIMAFSEDIASMALQVVRWFTARVRRSLLFVGSAERPVHTFFMLWLYVLGISFGKQGICR